MNDTPATDQFAEAAREQTIKCVVWDLDNTIWRGILLEDDHVALIPGVAEVVKTLDSRGILNSIASRNDFDTAMAKLEALRLKKYFLYPQISWNSKPTSIQEIARRISIGLDTIAFVDDQPFERDEVAFVLPQVRCFDAMHVERLLELPAMSPRFITEDSKLRRLMYMSDIERDRAEQAFVGSSEDFLASLQMTFTIACAQQDDLQRAEELTVRTHQLNTTGYTYSYDELDAFRQSDQHHLFVATLVDRYGTYGTIGLALVACEEEAWTLKLLLMSCRVMSRGVGMVMLRYIMRRAKEAGVRLRAEFVPNDRNRMMYITYKFTGFTEVARNGRIVVLEHALAHIDPYPTSIDVRIIDQS